MEPEVTRERSELDVFIICAPEDLDHGRALRRALEPTDAWLSAVDLVPGDLRDIVVPDRLGAAKLIAILVPAAPRPEWGHREEINQALALAEGAASHHRVVPIYIQGSKPPSEIIYGLRRIHGVHREVEGSWRNVARRLRGVLEHRVDGRDDSVEASTDRELIDRLATVETQRRRLLRHGTRHDSLESERRRLVNALRAGGRLQRGDCLAGRFRLEQRIGAGGFGQVWRAHDELDRLDVAVKILHAHHADDPHILRRFRRGARVMSQLEHPNIVRVRQTVAEDEKLYFYVMSYLPGGDLAEAIASGRVAPCDALTLLMPIADALRFAHQRGIFHRDVKPANILFNASGQACLTDFDLVRAPDTEGHTAGTIGSHGYMIPGSATDAAGPAADVFGLTMSLLSIVCRRPMGAADAERPSVALAEAAEAASPELLGALDRVLHSQGGLRVRTMEGFVATVGPVELDALRAAASRLAEAEADRSESGGPSLSWEDALGGLVSLGVFVLVVVLLLKRCT